MRRRFTILFLLVACAGLAFAQSAEPLPESPGALEYKSVAEALDALKSKPAVRISVTRPDGWVIVNEGRDIIWSFTPAGHYAHPAAVRRALVVRPGGELFMEMQALCQAQKDACDKLIREFENLNEQMRQNVQQRLKQQR